MVNEGAGKINRLLFWLFMLAGIFARIWMFGAVPGGINQDEAFAGYEAYSILNYGMDSAGYRFPVYLVAWGSGMNALETYLMIPFIAVFGFETWVIRLPQLIVGVLSLWVLYLTVRRLANERLALCALGLLAISPWHILLSRWGLESNLAPGFVLFGMYFFLRGLENSRYLMLSALMYGLSLYAYATIWPFVPLIILLGLVYCIIHKKIKFDRYLLMSAVILLSLALPLLLFLAVNYGIIEEIRLSFISIPRLLYMRSDELALGNIVRNIKNLLKLIVMQSDGLPWNFAGIYGLMYKISLPFTLLGIIKCSAELVRSMKAREFCAGALVLIQLLVALLLGMLIDANVNRVNILFIPFIILTAQGICWICSGPREKLLIVFFAVYMLHFVGFEIYYFNDYKNQIGYYFNAGLEQAMEAVEDTEGTVYVSADIFYPDILFYSALPVDEFLATVEYKNYPSAFLRADSFGRYDFSFDAEQPDETASYILSPGTDTSALIAAGFDLQQFEKFIVATKGN